MTRFLGNLLLLGFSAFLLSGAETARLEASESPAPSSSEDVLRAYLDVWKTGDVSHLADLVTQDFKRHAAVAPANTVEELARGIGGIQAYYKDLEIDIEDVVAGPDHGMARMVFSGGYGETSFTVKARSLSYFRFESGRIAEEWTQGNTLDMWTSFGYRLSPPQAELRPPALDAPAPKPPPEVGSAKLAHWVEETEAAARPKFGTLEITADLPCRLQLDGRSIGGLRAGESVRFPVEPGDHHVRALSLGGTPFHESTIEVKRKEQAVLEIETPGRLIVRARDQAVEDLNTGLMWQMKDNGANIGLPAAQAHCEALTQAGADDWRLPTIHELATLQAEESDKRFQSIDGIVLSDCCPWTSSSYEDDYQWTWVFHMGVRYLQADYFPWHMRVLCVRDVAPRGQAPGV